MQLTRYIFENLGRLHGSQWLGASRGITQPTADASGDVVAELETWDLPLDAKIRARLQRTSNIVELLKMFSLKSVRLDSQLGLLGYADRSFALDLRFDIPTPMEMLEHQCKGRRFVTLLLDPEDQAKQIGRFRGAFEFVMHDLEHANKFFGDPLNHRGQVRFFDYLKLILPKLEYWLSDPLFRKDLDYLMSDMNSHPVHLFKYLKAVVLTSTLRRNSSAEDSLNDLWTEAAELWQMDEFTLRAALRINHPAVETGKDQQAIADFFMRTHA